ncbi:Mss4-like protein [Xylogone sp. PMI_703]|nr:Mss4-like protein [Xylogone sp. PMI_703]
MGEIPPHYQGGCLCGEVRYMYNEEPTARVLCHCNDCHKISGSSYSINLLIPEATFRITSGTPKIFRKISDSGKTIDSYICGNCGSMMWRETVNYKGCKILKAGTLDDSTEIISSAAPVLEVFTRSRIKWVQPVANAAQNRAG